MSFAFTDSQGKWENNEGHNYDVPVWRPQEVAADAPPRTIEHSDVSRGWAGLGVGCLPRCCSAACVELQGVGGRGGMRGWERMQGFERRLYWGVLSPAVRKLHEVPRGPGQALIGPRSSAEGLSVAWMKGQALLPCRGRLMGSHLSSLPPPAGCRPCWRHAARHPPLQARRDQPGQPGEQVSWVEGGGLAPGWARCQAGGRWLRSWHLRPSAPPLRRTQPSCDKSQPPIQPCCLPASPPPTTFHV